MIIETKNRVGIEKFVFILHVIWFLFWLMEQKRTGGKRWRMFALIFLQNLYYVPFSKMLHLNTLHKCGILNHIIGIESILGGDIYKAKKNLRTPTLKYTICLSGIKYRSQFLRWNLAEFCLCISTIVIEN